VRILIHGAGRFIAYPFNMTYKGWINQKYSSTSILSYTTKYAVVRHPCRHRHVVGTPAVGAASRAIIIAVSVPVGGPPAPIFDPSPNCAGNAGGGRPCSAGGNVGATAEPSVPGVVGVEPNNATLGAPAAAAALAGTAAAATAVAATAGEGGGRGSPAAGPGDWRADAGGAAGGGAMGGGAAGGARGGGSCGRWLSDAAAAVVTPAGPGGSALPAPALAVLPPLAPLVMLTACSDERPTESVGDAGGR